MTTQPTATIEYNGGAIEKWRDNEGRLHRDGAPALIAYRENGTITYEAYYRDGQLHRDNTNHQY